MDFDAIANVSSVMPRSAPLRVERVTAPSGDAAVKQREPDQIERIVTQDIYRANPFRGRKVDVLV